MIIGSTIPNENMMNTLCDITTDFELPTVSSGSRLLERRESEENWEVLLAAFLDSQDIRQTSRDTYYWGMVQYFRWIQSSGRVMKTMTPADVMSFKSFLIKQKLSALTVSSYLTSVRRFYAWTENTMLYPNIARSVRPPRGKKGFKKMHLNESEAGELLSHLKAKSLRDYAIVNLILRTGLRTIEVIRADIGDIKHKRGRRILKVWGKGFDDKDNFVILGDATWNPIQEYLNSRGKVKKDDPLFICCTTQGFNRDCYLDHRLSYAKKVISGEIEDDRFIAFLFEQDSEQEIWQDSRSWEKSNPSIRYGVKKIDKLREDFQQSDTVSAV